MERDAFTDEIRTWLQNSGAVKSLQTKLRKVILKSFEYICFVKELKLYLKVSLQALILFL